MKTDDKMCQKTIKCCEYVRDYCGFDPIVLLVNLPLMCRKTRNVYITGDLNYNLIHATHYLCDLLSLFCCGILALFM